jgi:hypothetical protein
MAAIETRVALVLVVCVFGSCAWFIVSSTLDSMSVPYLDNPNNITCKHIASTKHTMYSFPHRTQPVWQKARTLAEASYIYGAGEWVQDHATLPALNQEERNVLQWMDMDSANRPLNDLTNISALWHTYAIENISLYNSSDTFAIAKAKYFCRLAIGTHECDPLRHGTSYHNQRWSLSSGTEMLDVFAQIQEPEPVIGIIGDSVMMETYQAALCSLARSLVEFVPCRSGLDAVCFHYKNGIATLARYSDRGYNDVKWFAFLADPRLHVVLANLGMHYNNHKADVFKYKTDLTKLVTSMRRASRMSPRKLVAFWGSTPQHYPTQSGSFHSIDNQHSCSPLRRDGSVFTQNRWRDEIVRGIISNGTSSPRFPGTTQYMLEEQTASEDTCADAGILHLEIWHWLVDRADAHPGRRCVHSWPVEYNGPNRGRCHYATDCTHHCWSPLLAQTLWERIEMAVFFHYSKC